MLIFPNINGKYLNEVNQMGTAESIIGMIPTVIATDIFVKTTKKLGMCKHKHKRKRKKKR